MSKNRKCGCQAQGRHRQDCILALAKFRDGVLLKILRKPVSHQSLCEQLYEELTDAMVDEIGRR